MYPLLGFISENSTITDSANGIGLSPDFWSGKPLSFTRPEGLLSVRTGADKQNFYIKIKIAIGQPARHTATFHLRPEHIFT